MKILERIKALDAEIQALRKTTLYGDTRTDRADAAWKLALLRSKRIKLSNERDA